LLVLALPAHAAEPLPRDAAPQHLGAATCASNQCHGNPRPTPNKSNILLDESLRFDGTIEVRGNFLVQHYKAYEVLKSAESKEMALRLGLPNAYEAKVCLDCHADNVPPEKRGKKFILEEGVSCEACHGGAENWIKSHAEENATHEDNLKRGLYATEDPVARAQMCLTCHYGNDKQFVPHRVMAAGHPRLAFDVAQFSDYINHWVVDDDYRKRKGEFNKAKLWAVGVLENARLILRVNTSGVANPKGEFAEWSLFDCHGCHRPIDDKAGDTLAPRVNTASGAMRLYDTPLLLTYAMVAVLEPGKAPAVLNALEALHLAASTSDPGTKQRVADVEKVIDDLQAKLRGVTFDDAFAKKMVASILSLRGSNNFRDFSDAQQSYQALLALTTGSPVRATIRDELKQMQAYVVRSGKFDLKSFRELMRSAGAKLGNG
jgi:hypothetical protein